MSQISLPPDVCKRIVRWAGFDELAALARTSLALQHEAESRLYETIEMVHSLFALRICPLLASCNRVAAHVRNFILIENQRPNRRRSDITPWTGQGYWRNVQSALSNLPSLKYLCISDPTLSFSWVLTPVSIPFRLREARLYLVWDPYMVAFLEGQDQLKSLFVADIPENVPRAPLSNGALPSLSVFEGPLILIDQLFHCPLTHLKVPIPDEDAVSLLLLVLPELSRFKSLRCLSISIIPDELSIECMLHISAACPQLEYLSHLPLPHEHVPRLQLMKCLMRMGRLATLELDLTHWDPRPVGPFQRMLALELRVACPSLQCIFIWHEVDRWCWQLQRVPAPAPEPQPGPGSAAAAELPEPVSRDGEIGDWRSVWSQPHYPQNSNIWRTL